MDRKIAILLDTSSNVLDDFMGKDMYMLPLYVHFNDKSYRDFIDITSREVRDRIEIEGLAKTSIPSIGEIKDFVEKIKSDGYSDLLYISVSSKLSGIHNAVSMVASEEKEINIRVIDTKNVSVAVVFLALYAQELIKKNTDMTLDELCCEIESRMNDSKIYMCLDTLKYLIAGGRVGKVAGSIGSLLKIMPIISCDKDGIYETVGKVRSLDKGVIDMCNRIREFVVENAQNMKKNHYVAVYYRDDEKILQKMEELLKDEISSALKFIKYDLAPPAVGVHSGFGVMAVAAFCF